ncbi:MAG: DUF4430 domain-containing protein [Anaerovoracaceae bacterium]
MARNSEGIAVGARTFEHNKDKLKGITIDPNFDYYLYFFEDYNNGIFAFYLIKWEKVGQVDKTALSQAIDQAPTDGYYTEGDRYNGKTVSEKGFWADYQEALARAKSVRDDPYVSEKVVSDALNDLNTATGNLIPATQLNPTYLYKWIQNRETISQEYLNACTPASAKDYTDAVEAGRDYLATLYTEEGAPTAENIAANQEKADAFGDAIFQTLDQMLSLDRFSRMEENYKAIKTLDGMRPYTENPGFTLESWARFIKAKTEADALHAPDIEKARKSDWEDYYNKVVEYWRAGNVLKSTGEKKVSLRITDDLGMRDTRFTIDNPMQYNGTYELETGTLKELMTKSGFTESQAFKHPPNYGWYWRSWAVHINGRVLAKPPKWEGDSVGLGGAFQDIYPYGDPTPEDDDKWERIQLHDGDEVVVSRLMVPIIPDPNGGIGGTWPLVGKVKNQIGMLSFVDETEKVTEEGKPINFSVQWVRTWLSTYTGKTEQNCTANLAVYGPQQEDGTYPSKAMIGDTMSFGKPAFLTLDKAGTYLVTAYDPEKPDLKNDFYPGYKAAAKPVKVIVKPASAETLKAAKDQYLKQLDELYGEYSEYNLGPSYSQATAAYEEAKETIHETDSVGTIKETFADFQKKIEELERNAGTPLPQAFMDTLKIFPTGEELEQGAVYKDSMGDLALWLRETYEKATPSQQDQLTPAQAAQYKAIIKLYGEDGSSLEKAGTGTLTVKLNKPELKETIGLKTQRVSRADKVAYWEASQPENATDWDTTIEGLTIGKDNVFVKLVLEDGIKDKYQIYGYRIGDGDLIETDGPEDFGESGITAGWQLKEGSNTITIYVKETDALEVLRTSSLVSLKEHFNSYFKSNYTEENWDKLVAAYDKGRMGIQLGNTEDQITNAKRDAQHAMGSIEKKTLEGYGSVTVKIANNTYPKKEGAPWEGDLLGEGVKVNLRADSSMIGCIGEALKENGYTAEGIEGGYISKINGLGHFDGGPGSGWMGTLNDWFTHRGFGEFRVSDGTLKDGDVISLEYTCALGRDIRGGTEGNKDTSLYSLGMSNGKLSPEPNGKIKSYVFVMDPGKRETTIDFSANNRSYQVRGYMNKYAPESEEWIHSGETLTVDGEDTIYLGIGNPAWPSMGKAKETVYSIRIMNEDSYKIVQKLIRDMTEYPQKTDPKNLSQVALARYAYDALNDESKEKVTNYKKLLGYEKDIENQKTVEEFQGILNKIPAEKKLTLSDKEAVEEMVKAYKGLPKEVKDILPVSDHKKVRESIDALGLLEIKDKAVRDMEGYKDPKDYREAEQQKLAQLVGQGKEEIGSAKDQAAVDKAVSDAKAEMDKLKTDVQYALEEKEEADKKAVSQLVAVLEELPGKDGITFAHGEKVKEAKAKYDALSKEARAMLSDGQRDKYKAIQKAYERISTTPTLNMLSGRLIYTKGSSTDTVFRVTDGKFENFVEPWKKVTVNGKKVVEGTDYTAREGSIEIRFAKEFLEGLDAGTYQVRVYEETGYAQGDLIIKEGKTDQNHPPEKTGAEPAGKVTNVHPKAVRTGDQSAIAFWALLMMFAGCTSAGALLRRRKS